MATSITKFLLYQRMRILWFFFLATSITKFILYQRMRILWFACSKVLYTVSKETYYSAKRDLLQCLVHSQKCSIQCQKRPISVKRDLLQCQKRPITVSCAFSKVLYPATLHSSRDLQ